MTSQQLPWYVTPETVDKFISAALLEDIGEGDHSTLAAVPADAQNQARLMQVIWD